MRSPTANMPSRFVRVDSPSATTILVVCLTCPTTSSDRGVWPIATNAPPTSSSSVSPVSACLRRILAELAVVAGDELLRDYGVLIVMLSRSRARSSMIFEARNWSRRCTIVRSSRELGDEDRVLHRGVAAADHRDVLALEEGAVADAAGGDAPAAELHLAGDAEALGLGAHREDDAAGAVLVVADPDGLDAAVGELDAGGVVG